MTRSDRNNLLIAGAVSILSAIVLVAMAFADYGDPTWGISYSYPHSIHNPLGRFGANLAFTMFFLFGGAAFLIPIVAIFLTMLHLSRNGLKKNWDLVVTASMLPIIVAVICRDFRTDFVGVERAGGLVGIKVYSLLVKLLGPLTSETMFVALFVATALVTRMIPFLYAAKMLRQFGQLVARISPLIWRLLITIIRLIFTPIMKFAVWGYKLLGGEAIRNPDLSIPIFDGLEEAENRQSQEDKLKPFELVGSYRDDSEIRSNEKREASSQKVEVRIDPKKSKPRYTAPAVDLLGKSHNGGDNKEKVFFRKQQGQKLEEKLEKFGVYGKVTAIKPGPVITLFEYQPEIDTKISRIVALEDDLTMALESLSIRIMAPVPGTSFVGFEVANREREKVLVRKLIDSSAFSSTDAQLPLALGVDITGQPVIEDLIVMPHLLIAGATGAGKSVGLNSMLLSLLFAKSPADLKLVLIDPKRLEFSPYEGIPHLLFPVVTKARDALPILQWVVRKMEDRYEKMAESGVRNIFDYKKVNQTTDGEMPFIVVVIDELSDLMMTASKEVEDAIARIAQMARAAGIHLIVATQRPSVDVLTGLIKANFPSRISFRVASKIDSRTILDASGADRLLGKGDMLFLNNQGSIGRIHGAFVSHQEIRKVTQHLKSQGAPEYVDLSEVAQAARSFNDTEDYDDGLYEEVLNFLGTVDEISISLLQRRFKIGYNRAARLVEQLEEMGMIDSTGTGSGKTRRVMRD